MYAPNPVTKQLLSPRMCMKTIRLVLLISSLLTGSVYLGAVFHARLFSIGDGLSMIKLNQGSMPEGFEISPEQAIFIHGSLLRNAWHWGADAVVDAYVDREAYYILGFGDLPQNQPYCSYTARMFGTCINGKDGTILSLSFGKWEKRGYIHLTKDEITQLIPEGMDISEVSDFLGQPFPGGGLYDRAGDENGKPIEAFHCWCKDGEIVIFEKESKVNHISFGTPGLNRV